jgi:hypothetical protein
MNCIKLRDLISEIYWQLLFLVNCYLFVKFVSNTFKFIFKSTLPIKHAILMVWMSLFD